MQPSGAAAANDSGGPAGTRPIERQIVACRAKTAERSGDVDLPRTSLGAADVAFGFQGEEVPGHPVGAADAERLLEFGDGGGAALAPAKVQNEIKDALLARGEHDTISIYT